MIFDAAKLPKEPTPEEIELAEKRCHDLLMVLFQALGLLVLLLIGHSLGSNPSILIFYSACNVFLNNKRITTK